MKIKTIDINAKEWFDKINGNSYFSAVITINYGMKSAKILNMPFQYGYGDHYIDMANKKLSDDKYINTQRRDNGTYPALYQYCTDNNIILRYNIQRNCKKRELMY